MSAKQRKLLWPVLIALAVIFGAVLWLSARNKVAATPTHKSSETTATAAHRETAAPAAAASLPQGRSQRVLLGAELLTITRRGFEPTEMSRADGHFFLAIQNRSGIGELNLKLIREAGDSLHEAHLVRGADDWCDVVNLPPGTYLIIEADHPKWVCHLTITGH